MGDFTFTVKISQVHGWSVVAFEGQSSVTVVDHSSGTCGSLVLTLFRLIDWKKVEN